MSTIDLMIIGLLLEKPRSAYDLAQIIETQVIGKLLKVSVPAVYKNIKNLYKAGYCTVEKVKYGEMPEKKIYTVTEKGKKYFLELMHHYSHNAYEFFFDFNMFLINIDKVDKKKGMEMLEALRQQLVSARTWIVQHEKEARNVFFAGRAIIKQYRMILTTLVTWIDEVIEEYKKEKNIGRMPF